MQFTFLFCSERSGSNLITSIFDSHPDYSGPAPVHLFRIILNHRNRYGNLSIDRNYDWLIHDLVELLNTNLGVWKSSWTHASLKEQCQGLSLSQILRLIFEQEARLQGKTRLFIKENQNYRFINFLKAGFPDARFVAFVRDPRDMALSWKRSPNLRGCVMRAAAVWQADQAQVLRLLNTQEHQPDIYLLKYEELLTRPEAELQSLCQYLGISFHQQMLQFSKNSDRKVNAGRSDDWKNLTRPLMTNNFKKYHQGLSESEIQYVEATCGAEMDELGYQREFESLPALDQLSHALEPLELWEKPAYANTLLVEKRIRAERFQVVQKIKQRPIQPLEH